MANRRGCSVGSLAIPVFPDEKLRVEGCAYPAWRELNLRARKRAPLPALHLLRRPFTPCPADGWRLERVLHMPCCCAGRPVVLLKGGPGVSPLHLADSNINLNAVLYRKKAAAAGGSGKMSAGAIAGEGEGRRGNSWCMRLCLSVAALCGYGYREPGMPAALACHTTALTTTTACFSPTGIAVGAACAAVSLALAAWAWVRRRRRLQRPAQQKRQAGADSPASCGASASSCGMADADDKLAWAGQPAPGSLGVTTGSASATAPGSSWDVTAGGGAAPGSGSAASGGVAPGSGSAASGGGFSRLVIGPGGEQHRAAATYWAEASTASGLGSLPPGQGRSWSESGQQRGVVGMACTPSPPPSAANSLRVPGFAPTTAAGVCAQAPVAAPPGRQPPGAAQHGRAAGQAAGSPRAAHNAAAAAAEGQALLSQLPTYGWQRCLVDYAAIEFVLDADGCPVELGAGASATVRARCASSGSVLACMLRLLPPHHTAGFRWLDTSLSPAPLPCIDAGVPGAAGNQPHTGPRPAVILSFAAGVPGAAQRRGAARRQGVPPRLRPARTAGLS